MQDEYELRAEWGVEGAARIAKIAALLEEVQLAECADTLGDLERAEACLYATGDRAIGEGEWRAVLGLLQFRREMGQQFSGSIDASQVLA